MRFGGGRRVRDILAAENNNYSALKRRMDKTVEKTGFKKVMMGKITTRSTVDRINTTRRI